MGQTSFRYFVITHFIVLILITPISQIPQYLTKISHNRPFCNRNVHKCVHSLQWRHNERDGVSNHQPHGCLLNCLVWRRSKNTPKLRVTGLCAGNSPVTGEFPAQRASNTENVSIWWRAHVLLQSGALCDMVLVLFLVCATDLFIMMAADAVDPSIWLLAGSTPTGQSETLLGNLCYHTMYISPYVYVHIQTKPSDQKTNVL